MGSHFLKKNKGISLQQATKTGGKAYTESLKKIKSTPYFLK
jgi:hypothetical protein